MFLGHCSWQPGRSPGITTRLVRSVLIGHLTVGDVKVVRTRFDGLGEQFDLKTLLHDCECWETVGETKVGGRWETIATTSGLEGMMTVTNLQTKVLGKAN